VIPYAEFVRQHAGLSKERFLERVREPHFLLFFQKKEAGDPGETPFLTTKIDLRGALAAESRPFLVPVRKGQGNAFGMMITIGRAANNDVVIKHPSVSKFHAYLRQNGERWSLFDANALNGTAIDGKRLAAETAYPLVEGKVVHFAGAVVAEFLRPEELYERLELEDALGSTDPAESVRQSDATTRVKWRESTDGGQHGPEADEETKPLRFL
jgi:pSer/pThr/pTyr-binding forkhead associated (FHA) protein